MFNSQIFGLVRRTAVFGVLVLALGVLLFERPAVVRADDCGIAELDFDACYDTCSDQRSYCRTVYSFYPEICDDPTRGCLMSCDAFHETEGQNCDLPHHASPINPTAPCHDNADNLYDNCVSGPVPQQFVDAYLTCMVDANADPSQVVTCCSAAEDNYLSQACF